MKFKSFKENGVSVNDVIDGSSNGSLNELCETRFAKA